MKKSISTAVICLCLAASAAFAQQKPNIILVLTDDMGVGDIGCYGGSLVPTPHLNRMAAEGIRFTQYYSASPICSPSRAGLLTGTCPARWNITSYLQTKKGNAACGQADFLTADAPSVARLLKNAGYHTGHFGKWHLGGGRDVTNAPSIHAYGFDEYSSTWESPDPDPLITAENWIWSKTDSVKRWDRTGYFVDRTLAFLAKHKGQPCFVNLWPDDVHTPWIADEDDMLRAPQGAQGQQQFEAVMKNYDVQIGRLLEGLKKLGIDQHTIVIFTSDNGALPTFNTRSGQYRGSKLSLYEGGIRMPFIVRYPGTVKGGQVDSVSVLSATDMLPTFCKLAGVQPGQQPAVDGMERAEVLLGKPSARERSLFWEYGRNDSSFGYPRGKNRSPAVAVREGKWKLLVHADGSGAELYDLATDPGEQHNVATQHAAATTELKNKALGWYRSLPRLARTNSKN
ncbi:sulfatase family protein [Chitinophaga alhagiae]|uniref:sulfatase family protein n=1 Tax=Chitinophaga alhagiae TaxID=2203219 RepID=UPI000E5C1E0F|nr:sulfatase-like hydrolase/transferase [Chitinophaga alhagiae]